MQWAEASLGSICDDGQGLIKTGPFGSQLHQSDYCVDGTPVVMPKDIVGGRLVDVSIARVSQEHIDRLAHHKLKAGDIVYGRRGDIGRCALIRERESGWLCGTGCLRVSLGEGDVLPQYLFYYLNDPSVVAWISNQAVGATMPNLNTGILRSIPVRYPPKGIQNRIVSILSAYDDLIENNTRRIEILEEIARRLYEEWFVQFRFPGYEGVFDTDGLPQGWRYSKLSEIASYIGRGISPKYDEEADCLVINQKCIRNQRLDVQLSRRQSKKVPVEKLIQFGDVLINSTGVGTLGRVAQVHEVLEHVTVDSHVTIARAGEFVDVDYFGSTLLSMQHFFELQGVGSTGQTELSRSRIAEADVIVPPYELQTRFGKSIRSMRLLCAQLAKKNSNLRAQRDLLLPKLISGEIDVSDIPMPT